MAISEKPGRLESRVNAITSAKEQLNHDPFSMIESGLATGGDLIEFLQKKQVEILSIADSDEISMEQKHALRILALVITNISESISPSDLEKIDSGHEGLWDSLIFDLPERYEIYNSLIEAWNNARRAFKMNKITNNMPNPDGLLPETALLWERRERVRVSQRQGNDQGNDFPKESAPGKASGNPVKKAFMEVIEELSGDAC